MPKIKTNYKVAQLDANRYQENEAVEVHSSLHRFLHFSFGLIIAVITIGLAWFFGNNYSAKLSSEQIVLQKEGTVLVIDEFSNQQNVLKDEINIFPGDTIKTSAGSSALITLPDSSELRLKENTEIVLNTKNDIYVKEGQLWVFANENVKVEAQKSIFNLKDASFDLIVDSTFEATSWRHNVEMIVLLDNLNKTKEMFLPAGTRVMYSPDSLQSDLTLLRYSKVKKELRLHAATATSWERENLEKDKKAYLKIKDQLVANENYENPWMDKIFAFRKVFTFIPGKNDALQEKITNATTNNIFNNLKNQKINNAIDVLVSSNLSEEKLQDLWQKTYLLADNDEYFLELNHEVESLWLKKYSGDKNELQKYLLRASLNLIEDYIDSRDSDLLAIELADYKNLWSTYEGDNYSDELYMHREVFFRLALFYINRVDEDMLTMSEWLDDLALAKEPIKSIDLLKLEIAQNNLTLVESFMDNERYFLAKDVVENTRQRLSLQEVPEVFNVRAQILAKEDLLDQKLAFISETGSMNEEEFQRYLLEKEKEQELIKELTVEDKKEMTPEEIEEYKNGLLAEVRDSFATQGITMISFDFQGESESVFTITKAILPTGKFFSASYNSLNQALSDIQFEDGTKYSAGIKLAQLVWLSNELFADNTDTSGDSTDLHAAGDDNAEEDTSYEPISATLTSLLRKTTQKYLEEYNITVEAKDITPISRNEVKVASAAIPDVSYTLSFEFNVDTKALNNIYLADIKISNTDLENLKTVALSAVDQQKEVDTLVKTTKNAFKSLNMQFELGKNMLIDTNTNTARFSNLNYSIDNQIFSISGIYQPENLIFMSIAEKDNKFSPLRNVRLTDFGESIKKAYEDKLAELTTQNTELKNQLKQEEMINAFVYILDSYDANYEKDKIIAYPDKDRVVFSQVYLNNFQVWIAGEYDAVNKIFTIITSASFEDKTNLTMDQLEADLSSTKGE